MAKINISVPDSLPADVDLLAEERVRRIGAAMASARQLAHAIGHMDAAASVRRDRDRDDRLGTR